MKRRLGWRQVSRDELSGHLEHVEVTASEAVGEASLYRCQGKSGESVAISLPSGAGLIIELRREVAPVLERRRQSEPGEEDK
ncbi:MAG: hypothetical protein IPL58_03090 [Betaproteobacteria bacterium]|uniref:Uncharacterized protein n=1 Tax=Candidatus Proximibacter danicus TaxID=2954365 RepID=A0A9D7PQL7_9PROT|nr:hypothetical protein [Candidatus Proximibacter danicus]MBK9446108.1 hypothetical protein [Betaproteobacteria bacterium]